MFSNIMKAREYALKYWKLGYAVICPHLNNMLMDGELPDQSWLDGDLVILSKCEIIVMIPGWEDSEGAKAELEFAKNNNISVIYESI